VLEAGLDVDVHMLSKMVRPGFPGVPD